MRSGEGRGGCRPGGNAASIAHGNSHSGRKDSIRRLALIANIMHHMVSELVKLVSLLLKQLLLCQHLALHLK